MNEWTGYPSALGELWTQENTQKEREVLRHGTDGQLWAQHERIKGTCSRLPFGGLQ